MLRGAGAVEACRIPALPRLLAQSSCCVRQRPTCSPGFESCQAGWHGDVPHNSWEEGSLGAVGSLTLLGRAAVLVWESPLR